MGKERTTKDEREDRPSRTEEAKSVAQEYADDQRRIINKLRKPAKLKVRGSVSRK